MKTSQDWITQLALEPHPEGGYFKRIYESNHVIATASGQRHSATAIHYLLTTGDFSAWHRLQQDEIWFHQAGSALCIRCIDQAGVLSEILLGKSHALTTCVPANTWFCSELAQGNDDYSLVSCVVTPGFDFADFEMAKEKELASQYPQHSEVIHRLCRG